MTELDFKENDTVGANTLNTIHDAFRFNRWVYQAIKPYCKGKVLEVGSGIGNISTFFLHDGVPVMLTDIRKSYCEKLERTFGDKSSFLGTRVMDLADVHFDEKFSDQLSTYDTVFALNVVEHIFDDSRAINNCYKLLKENGHLVILVPSYQTLFNNFDTELGHYRRYTKSSLSKLFLENNFEIIHRQYFNFVGIPGWFVSGKLQRNSNIPDNQMKLFDFLVPLSKVVDSLLFNTVGLSTIVVGRKKKSVSRA